MTTSQIKKIYKEEHKLIKSPWLKNKLINTGIYMGGLLVLLLVNYLACLGFKGNIWIWLDILLMILFVSPIFFFKGTMFDRIYLPIILALITAFLVVNVNYYEYFGVVFTLKDLKMALDNISQAGQHAGELNWKMIAVDIVLCCIFIAGILVFNIRFNFKETSKQKNPTRKHMHIIATSILGGSLLLYEFSMGMWVVAEKNRKVDSIKYVNYNPNYHFQNIGMISYYNREIRQLMTDKGISEKQVITYLQEAKLVKDDYTGLLTSNGTYPNIFVIMIETGDKMMLNEYLTPNLWKIFKENGLYADHNYSYNHTNVSNQTTINGCAPLKPLDQNLTYNIPFNLPHILKAKNYNTRYYYDSIKSEDTYNDMGFIPTLGFDNYFYHDGIIPELEPWYYMYANYTRDSIVWDGIQQNLSAYVQTATTPFYAQWMTMHMHMSQIITDKNKQMIQGLYDEFGPRLNEAVSKGYWHNPCTGSDSKQRFEIYTLKTMDFDKALGNVFNYFYGSDDPYLNNTLLVAFGDHPSYEKGDDKWLSKWAKGIDENDNINLYSTVLGMYHPLLNEKIKNDTTGLFINHDVQKQTCPACVVPTILDLLGIPFNNKIYQDHSIFDLEGNTKYTNEIDDVYYSSWINLFMSEYYTSSNGASITKTIKENGNSHNFIKKVVDKQLQLRVLDYIFHNRFFDNNKYEDFIPKTNSPFIYNTKEYKIVKYYE